jgi:hypothetical protein
MFPQRLMARAQAANDVAGDPPAVVTAHCCCRARTPWAWVCIPGRGPGPHYVELVLGILIRYLPVNGPPLLMAEVRCGTVRWMRRQA